MERDLHGREPNEVSNNTVTALERTLEVHLAEYETLRRQIDNTFDMRRQIVSFSILAAGGLIPLAVGFGEGKVSAEALLYLMLFIPVVFAGATLAYAGQNRGASMSSAYIHAHLRPRIKRVLTKMSSLTDAPEGVLGWEYYVRVAQQPSSFDKLLMGLTGIGDFLILYSPVVGGILGFLYLRTTTKVALSPALQVFLWFDVVVGAFTLVSVVRAGMGYYESKYMGTEQPQHW